MCGGGGEGGRRWFGFKVREGGERVSGMAGGAPGWSGCGPILSRSKSATLPNFYRLIYAPGDHIRSGLVEICGAKEKKHNRVTIKLTTVTLTTFLPPWASIYPTPVMCLFHVLWLGSSMCFQCLWTRMDE